MYYIRNALLLATILFLAPTTIQALSHSLIQAMIEHFSPFDSLSAVIGTPAEIYEFGFEFWFFISGLLLSIVFVSHAVLPVVYDLNLTSAYEYLEIRFKSKWPRRLGAAIFILEVRSAARGQGSD